MIQRIQSVWLLLASIFDAITFRFPFFVGDWTKDAEVKVIGLDAETTLPLTILTVIIGGLAFVNIFLFNNRKLQLRLTFLGMLLSALLLVLYFIETKNFNPGGGISLWCLFYFAIFLFTSWRPAAYAATKNLSKALTACGEVNFAVFICKRSQIA